MSQIEWLATGMQDAAALAAARGEAHAAIQILARAARAALPAKPDDSHTNLGWSRQFGALCAHPTERGLRLGVRLEDMSLIALAGDEVVDDFSLMDKSMAEGEAWAIAELLKAGASVKGFDDPLPYDIPSDCLSEAFVFGNAGLGALKELSNWYANADAALKAFAGRRRDIGAGPSPVRCWPHHFDIATLILIDGEGETMRSVGAGLSPGDENYSAPYFYVTPWPYPDAEKLFRLTSGRWRTQGFTAAILEASDIAGAEDPRAYVEAFLDEGAAAALKALGA